MINKTLRFPQGMYSPRRIERKLTHSAGIHSATPTAKNNGESNMFAIMSHARCFLNCPRHSKIKSRIHVAIPPYDNNHIYIGICDMPAKIESRFLYQSAKAATNGTTKYASALCLFRIVFSIICCTPSAVVVYVTPERTTWRR